MMEKVFEITKSKNIKIKPQRGEVSLYKATELVGSI